MDLAGKVKEFFHRHGALRDRRLLAAVSGGPDSVALLHLLYELREELGLDLEVAHLQHGIRGQETRDDARFVAALAHRLGLPCHVRELDLRQAKSAAGKGNLEEMGRLQRYRFFADLARLREIGVIATGHTLDDQAETLLMRVLRGAGRTGLSAMAEIRSLERAPAYPAIEAATSPPLLIRPLLGVSRQELLDFLSSRSFGFCIDSSNSDVSFLRNWLRLRLMPQLEEKFGVRLARRLCQQAAVLRDEESFLTQESRSRLDRIRGDGGLDRAALLDAGRALQRRIIRLWIEEKRGHLRGIDSDHIEAALSLVADGPVQGRLALPAGWELVRDYDFVRLEKGSRRIEKRCFSYPLQAGAHLEIIDAGMKITSDWLHDRPIRLPQSLMEAVFDADLLSENLIVRNFRSGDRIRPFGMTGHKKVKDLFIDRKLPLRLRAVLPMLVMGSEILWIPGHARSDFATIGERTRRALYLRASAASDRTSLC